MKITALINTAFFRTRSVPFIHRTNIRTPMISVEYRYGIPVSSFNAEPEVEYASAIHTIRSQLKLNS